MAIPKGILLACVAVLLVAFFYGCGGPKPETAAPPTTTTSGASSGGVVTEEVIYRVTEHWSEVDKLYQFLGGTPQPCVEGGPSPMPKVYPDQLSPAVKAPAIFAHPASSKKGEVGETILRFTVSLPDKPAKFAFGAFLSQSTGPSDGSNFVIKVDGKELFKELIVQNSPQRRVVDLNEYSGKTVDVQMITDVGPGKNAAADWAIWLDPRIVSTN